jgi:hypothetical protein
LFGKRIKGKGGIEKMGWKIIDRLREKKWFVFLFSILFLALNIGCGKKSSGGEGISNKEISNEGISKVEKCPVWYKDADGDGYTDGTTKVSCEQPVGYVSQALPGDCDDNDKNINPNTVWFRDEDKDGYYPEGFTVVSCTAPAGYVLSAKPGDCNDNDPNINPGKTEICDGKDNNCNNQIDEGVLLVFYKDSDKDGYTDGTTKVSCSKPSDEYVSSATSGDCNDNDPNINPGKTEICDNKDNNCNGQIDEGNVCTFAKTIGGSFSDDYAYSIIQSSDGGYVVAGWTKSLGAGYDDFYVVKLDSLGNVIWSKTIGGNYNDRAYSIIQSSDGGYVIAGYTGSFGAGGFDIYVVKLDSSGNIVWSKTIGGSYDDEARSIIQSSDGGYVIAGKIWNFMAGRGDMYVVKLDANGNVQWAKTIGGGFGTSANSIIQSSDGGYVVAGLIWNFGAGGFDMYVVKLDSSGNVQWTKTIGGSYEDVAYSIIQSSDGGYVIAGRTNRSGSNVGLGYTDIYVVKLDSSGNVLWTKTIGGRSSYENTPIIQSSDGGYVVAGESGGDIHVVKLDSLGNVIWSKTIGGSNNDIATSIIQSSDGRYVVAGWTNSFGAGSYDFYVVKMDANGNVCFSRNTTYSVLSNVGNVSSLSPVVISQSPTVNSVFPIVVSYGVSVKDVCALASAPHLNICSESQDCGFSSSIANNGENVKSYVCSAGSVFSRFLIPASMLIIYVQLRRKKKKKKG